MSRFLGVDTLRPLGDLTTHNGATVRKLPGEYVRLVRLPQRRNGK